MQLQFQLSRTFHRALQRQDRVDFRDEDASSEGSQCLSATLADVTVSRHAGDLSGQHDVSGTLDAVDERLATSIEIVELAL